MNRVPIENLGPPRFPSPLRLAEARGRGLGLFVPDGASVRWGIEVAPDGDNGGNPDDPSAEPLAFEKAGPRPRLYFDPAQTRAAIVTCGGLCPGLNNVIRSIFLELFFNYGVREVYGIRDGYLGLDGERGRPPIPLTREFVSEIHAEGGTVLGSSRGEQDPAAMVDFLLSRRINILFCIGGDGTQRGSRAIREEARRRGLDLAVVGIPKTIDNDLSYCDRTFGVSTAVEKAREVAHLAHNEAKGVPRGIGLVKLMGRESGFIAGGAALASQVANFVLIPEVPFRMEGEGGFLAALAERMDRRGHAVVIVAEGAGQHLFAGEPDLGVDASGNRKFHDIGPFLKGQIHHAFERSGAPVDVKYIDPSYIIRSLPANCDDSLLCDQLARRAVDAAMAGKTGLIVSLLNNAFVHVPIDMAVERKRKVDPEGRLWNAVLSTTGQPPHFA